MSFPWASEAEYHAFYADEAQYHTGQQMKEGFLPTRERDEEHRRAASTRVMVYAAMGIRPATLLDFGCGGGAFVDQASAYGWEATGYEPCVPLAEWASERYRNVSAESPFEAGVEFDFITAHDVLEHLTRPEATLRRLRTMMRGDGALAVEMPEANGPFGAWEKHLRPKQHVCLYSKAAAEALYARCGFEVEAFWRPKRGTLGKMTHLLRKD